MKEDFYGEIARRVAQPDSGATVDPRTGEEPQSGWATAIAGHEHIEPAQTFSEDSIKRYAGEHRDALSQGRYMGLWHEPESGQVYHDVSEVRPSTYRGGVTSIARGYQQGQQAIFHIDSLKSLYMHPESKGQQRSTRSTMAGLRRQRRQEVGPEGRVSQMSPEDLGAALRGRRTIQEGPSR